MRVKNEYNNCMYRFFVIHPIPLIINTSPEIPHFIGTIIRHNWRIPWVWYHGLIGTSLKHIETMVFYENSTFHWDHTMGVKLTKSLRHGFLREPLLDPGLQRRCFEGDFRQHEEWKGWIISGSFGFILVAFLCVSGFDQVNMRWNEPGLISQVATGDELKEISKGATFGWPCLHFLGDHLGFNGHSNSLGDPESILWEIHSWASTFLMSKNSILWEIHICSGLLGCLGMVLKWWNWLRTIPVPLAPESL